ncbi:MAG: redoxin domain-containing protein [Acidobacteria bacterium]|nr:MAG: redoxin domain-containing protein [Acidobacteriota bacterium]
MRSRKPFAGRRPGPLLLLLGLALACSGSDLNRATRPDVAGVEDLEGRPLDPFDDVQRGTVLIFARSDCPISNRYAPEIRRITERFTAEGVRFWLVYPDDDDTSEVIRAHAGSFGYTQTAVRDRRHALVKAAGVRVTPEVAVFDAQGRLLYAGRIDDQYVDFGKRRATPTVRNLENAIVALLAGRAPATPRTTAIGCTISPAS